MERQCGSWANIWRFGDIPGRFSRAGNPEVNFSIADDSPKDHTLYGSLRRIATHASADMRVTRDNRSFVNVGGLHAFGAKTDRDEARAHPTRERRAFEQP